MLTFLKAWYSQNGIKLGWTWFFKWTGYTNESENSGMDSTGARQGHPTPPDGCNLSDAKIKQNGGNKNE